MNQFVEQHKDARLIIIDTLQKVKEIGGDKFSYADDYQNVTRLKAFSDKYGVCILLVHHTRKLDSSDSFERISGTNGLLGAADGAFVMEKEKANTIIKQRWKLRDVISQMRKYICSLIGSIVCGNS